MKIAHWCCAAMVVLTPATLLAEERPTAEELLSAYEKSVEQLSRVRIERKQKGPARGPFDFEWTVLRDAGRWKIEKTFVPNGNRPAAKRTKEQTLVGNELVTLSLRYNQDDNPRIGALTAHLERVASRSWIRLGPNGVLFGRVPGDGGVPVWTVMRESGTLERLPKTELVNGTETYVLKSRGKYGEHKLWLDPASGSLPRRIEVTKVAGNLFNEQQLGTAPVADAQPNPRAPNAAVQLPSPSGFSTLIDNIQIENKDGKFVITGFEEKGSITHADGKIVNQNKTEIKFDVVDVNPPVFPENAFRFEVEIPNGTLVSVVDDLPPGYQGPAKTEHEWVDGKIRALTGR